MDGQILNQVMDPKYLLSPYLFCRFLFPDKAITVVTFLLCFVVFIPKHIEYP